MLYTSAIAHAEVQVETSVSRSRLAVGEELTLDIIITNANGAISKPSFSSVNGFTSYSQGHSQEISFINGESSSRSIFSYIMIANSVGKKTIGPFDVKIGDKDFKVAPVEVEVLPDNSGSTAQGTPNVPQGPVVTPPPRALPGGNITNEDIFVKAWLDKDEVAVNEPVILTYTIYTRLSATYKGFEKEPVTTGLWVEDFPPDKATRKTEQIFNGTRYVVADVRKMALFPTQAGIFTIDPGALSTTVEVRDHDDFDNFVSYNIFGRRSSILPSSFTTQIYSKSILADKVTITVKTLPETGRPASFNGAVGDYQIESSLDKTEAEEGNPVTYRIRIKGQGNINTIQTPALPKMDNFKIYDSASSVNISKERLVVEGEKVTETVLVPKKAGSYTIPALAFSYFDPRSQSYKELKTSAHPLTVKPGEVVEEPKSAGGVVPVEKEEVSLMGQDIRYIKTSDEPKALPARELYRSPLYWLINLFLFISSLGLLLLSGQKGRGLGDPRSARLRDSHAGAKRRLKKASGFLQQNRHDEFYAEMSKAVYGYFGDKLNISSQSVTPSAIEQAISEDDAHPEVLNEIRSLLDELAHGRFASMEKSQEEMKGVFETANHVITVFEKIKLR